MDERNPHRRRPAAAAAPAGVIITTLGLVLTGLSAYLVAGAALLDGSAPWHDVPLLGETSNVSR